MGLDMGQNMSIFIRDGASSWEALQMSNLRPHTRLGNKEMEPSLIHSSVPGLPPFRNGRSLRRCVRVHEDATSQPMRFSCILPLGPEPVGLARPHG